MSDSLSAWLALRQAADVAARSTALTELIVDRLADTRPLRILDLGTGTGSNIRYLAPKLGGEQQWLAIDKDPALLAEAVTVGQSIVSGVQVETRALDLGAVDAPEIFEGRHLVTASALLDLVSERWIRWVASECRRVGCLCALSDHLQRSQRMRPARSDGRGGLRPVQSPSGDGQGSRRYRGRAVRDGRRASRVQRSGLRRADRSRATGRSTVPSRSCSAS